MRRNKTSKNKQKLSEMKEVKEEIRMYDDSNLVEYRTNLEGWTGQDGLYHGKGAEGERRARYANSTHTKCECGAVIKKMCSKCQQCISKHSRERFLKLEEVEWDGESIMCLRHDNKFFSDMDEVFCYCEEEEIDIKDLELMHCEKQVHISEINIDELNDEYYTGDGDLGVSYYHPEIAKKTEELNKLIREIDPIIWFQTKKRIKQ